MTIEADVEKLNYVFGTDKIDADKVMPLVRLGHKESYFADIPFEEGPYHNLCNLAFTKPNTHGAIYVEHEGEPVATAFFVLRGLFGSNIHRTTMIHGIYIRSDIRATELGGEIWHKMLSIIFSWGLTRSSKGMMINVATGVATKETDIAVRSRGGVFLGGNYFIRS